MWNYKLHMVDEVKIVIGVRSIILQMNADPNQRW